MPFDYENNTLAIVNALTAYNTTTAVVDLSSGLTTRVKNIYRSDPDVVDLRGDIYPAVFVRVSRKEESFAGLGATGPTGARKHAVVTYDVIGLYRKDGMNSTQQAVLVEIERLAENIEGVFQREYTLSATALFCNPVSTNFLGPFGTDNMWIKGVIVELEAEYHFR